MARKKVNRISPGGRRRQGLEGKRVLVTGAARGIGASITEELAEAGASVGVHYCRSGREAEALCERLADVGLSAKRFEADLLDEGSAEPLVSGFVERFGGIDALVNNAGDMFARRSFAELPIEVWRQTMQLNFFAPVLLTQAALRHMKAPEGGRIINISSVGVKYAGSASTLHYAASKSALELFTKGLAKEGAKRNVLANAIRPGVIDTAFHDDYPKEDMDARVQLIPLRRMGQPQDVARMVAYLLSSAGDFITGEVFTVAGGD